MSCIEDSLLAYDQRIEQLEEEKKKLFLKYYQERLDLMEMDTEEEVKYLEDFITGMDEQSLEILKNIDMVTSMTKDKSMKDIRSRAWKQYQRMKEEISLFHTMMDTFKTMVCHYKCF